MIDLPESTNPESTIPAPAPRRQRHAKPDADGRKPLSRAPELGDVIERNVAPYRGVLGHVIEIRDGVLYCFSQSYGPGQGTWWACPSGECRVIGRAGGFKFPQEMINQEVARLVLERASKK